jgi:hypothetical protein
MVMVIDDLPSEIFFRIFSYVPPAELAATVSLVSSHWRSFSIDEFLWRYHCLSRWGYWKHTQAQLDDPEFSWLKFFQANVRRSNMKFLVLGAEGGGVNDERLFDVQSKLKLGGLTNVETFNVRTRTPNLEYVQSFDAILFFSYHGFDQVSLGNMLATYVEAGGGVVFCAYSNCGRGNKLDGNWAEKKYDPLTLGATSRTPYLSLGKVHSDRHPVLMGVDIFNGGEQSSHGDGLPHVDAKVVIEWSNGHPLVVELNSTPTRSGTIVGLNMYPPSSDSASGGWNAATCGARLMANSLYYVSRGSLTSSSCRT